MDYRIVRREWYDEKGAVAQAMWHVEEWRRGWFREAWRPLKHGVCYGMDCFDTTTEFDSLEDAKACIERLKAGAPRQTNVMTIETSV